MQRDQCYDGPMQRDQCYDGPMQRDQGSFDNAQKGYRGFIRPEHPAHYKGLHHRGNLWNERGRMHTKRGGRRLPHPSERIKRSHGNREEHLRGRMVERDEKSLQQKKAGSKEHKGSVASDDKNIAKQEDQSHLKAVTAQVIATGQKDPKETVGDKEDHPDKTVTDVIPPKQPVVVIQPVSAETKHSISPNKKNWSSPTEVGPPQKHSPFHQSNRSPFHGNTTGAPRPGSKRRSSSPSVNQDDSGSKVQIATSPTGEPSVKAVQPFGYCWLQLNKGQCSKTGCRFTHLSAKELQEVILLHLVVPCYEGSDTFKCYLSLLSFTCTQFS